MAWHEQRSWLTRVAEAPPRPELNEIAANGAPAATPPLGAMLAAWDEVTARTDLWLDGLGRSELRAALPGTAPNRTIGSALQRVIYHYWFHTGEILAIRQVLGNPGLPEFVGNIDDEAPWRLG